MTIKDRMEAKLEEKNVIKQERETLFENFEENKDRISKLYLEMDIMDLQYLFLKREQLTELSNTAIDKESVESIVKINESCIKILQEKLVDYGYEERLEQEMFI